MPLYQLWNIQKELENRGLEILSLDLKEFSNHEKTNGRRDG
jgi:hypothetical protein